MAKKYWNLFIKESKNDSWSLHFGDYDKEVVKEEAADCIDSGFKTWIIQSADSQADIDKCIEYVKGK